jgi:hypothetical protein
MKRMLLATVLSFVLLGLSAVPADGVAALLAA